MDTESTIKLATELGSALQKQGIVLTLAESCTGGQVSAAITDIAGSSTWFDRGFVTYSNAAKQEMLGVDSNTIDQHGAVSEETAIEMATGALNHSQADIAVSITGIAGPTGGSASKPVGTVCFAWVRKSGKAITSTEHFTGNRQSIRHQSTVHAIAGIFTHLISA
jgi:nicotinamide-nucleotide amidase